MLLMWSVMEIDRINAFQQKFSRQFTEPDIPEFPPGKATFIITEGKASPQTLASIQSLHDIYNKDYERLKSTYEGRQRAQFLREAELTANPPQPKDITLNYWRIEPTAKGDGQ